MPTLCPFCWARAAGEVWVGVSAFLFAPDRPQVARFDLVSTERVIRLDGDLGPLLRWRLGINPGGPLEGRPGESIGLRRTEMDRLNHAAAYEVVAWRPTAVRANGEWQPRMVASIRQLFALPEGASLGTLPRTAAVTRTRVVRHRSPSDVQAARLVAALCRYPRQLLLPHPSMPDPTLHSAGLRWILENRRGKRLWAGFGGFRAGCKARQVRMDAGAGPPASIVQARSLR